MSGGFFVLFKDTDRYKLLRKLELIQVSIKKLRIVENRVVTVSIGALIDDIDSKEALYKAVSESLSVFSKLNKKKYGILHVIYTFYLLFFCKDKESSTEECEYFNYEDEK